MNIHTPQRVDGESFDAYRERRAESNRRVKAMLHPERALRRDGGLDVAPRLTGYLPSALMRLIRSAAERFERAGQ